MPWGVHKRGDRWCVYKHDENGEPVGDTLGCHDTEQEAIEQMRALYAAEPGIKAVTKREADGEHPASHYLVVEDPESPSTWHLRYRDADGNIDHGLCGAAWAALHEGYRGNRYEGPKKREAIARLRRIYEEQGWPIPGEEKAISLAVKALGANRFGGYAILWGSPAQRDLTGEYFTPETQDLLALFRAIGKLPALYHHAGDDGLKTTVIGPVDVLAPDEVGLWYEGQLTLAGEYRKAVQDLMARGLLGTSTGTLPLARKVAPDGRILRWPIAEVSLTPTPAEPRMLERPVAAIKAAYKAIGIDLSDQGLIGGAEEARDRSREIELEIERIRILELEAME